MNTTEIIKKIPLFSGCTDETAAQLYAHGELRALQCGEYVCRTGDTMRALILVLQGNLTVTTADGGGNSAVLRTITAPGLFGMSTLFGGDGCAVSTVQSRGISQILTVGQEEVEALLRRDADLAVRYIELLSSRVRFLNGRIGTFTAGCAEKRLTSYLLQLPSQTDGTVKLPVSCQTLSEMLDIGRASLYRAFDFLQDRGLAVRDGKTVHIPDREALVSFIM